MCRTCDNEKTSKGLLRRAEIQKTMSSGSVARVAGMRGSKQSTRLETQIIAFTARALTALETQYRIECMMS